MFTEPTAFRPRNGAPAQAYWEIREWCSKNGFSMSDVLNAIVIPLAYYLNNHCRIDTQKSMAVVELNIGNLPIFHVFNGGLYPLRSKVDSTKDHPDLEEIQRRVAHWREQNRVHPNRIDLLTRKEAHE